MTWAKPTKYIMSGTSSLSQAGALRCSFILYTGEGECSKYDEDGLGYYVQIHILAGIGNKPGGGGDIRILDLWFRTELIDKPSAEMIPILVS